jgi:hydroxymethylpyrimidine/phosphomethylpyrimidine kinase
MNPSRLAGEVEARSTEGEGDRVAPQHPHPRCSRDATSLTKRERLCRVLAIAGSDSGGGAGIQADIKTITVLGGYAATAITALTAQDTLGVQAIHMVPPDFVARQIAVVLDDIGADAVKTGMLGDAATVEAVASALARHAPGVPLVVDPVMVAKGGASLLRDDAVAAVIRLLLPMASVITPNLPEAEVLSGFTIPDVAAMRQAAAAVLRLGVPAVLLKGGHLPGDDVVDLLVTRDGCEAFAAPRIASRHTHGTGCTLASAIATGLAQSMTLRDAVVRARAYVRAAITAAPEIGKGHGPLNHYVSVLPPA